MEIELQNFQPRVPVVFAESGTKNWAAFVVGKDDIARLTIDGTVVRVVFNDGRAWRVCVDGWAVEKMAEKPKGK
jgi:hypothetical protein